MSLAPVIVMDAAGSASVTFPAEFHALPLTVRADALMRAVHALELEYHRTVKSFLEDAVAMQVLEATSH